MTKTDADVLKGKLDDTLTYVNIIISQQIRALKIDIDNLTEEE